jgi:hypothetical protein
MNIDYKELLSLRYYGKLIPNEVYFTSKGVFRAINKNRYTEYLLPTNNITGLNKSSVGLNNVDNTSDLNKPVSVATEKLLIDNYYPLSNPEGYINLETLNPYLKSDDAENTYYPLTNPENYISIIKSSDVTNALGYTPVKNDLTTNTTSPLLGGGDLTTNRTLSISQSNTLTDGYLSSTDWNTFNNKSKQHFNNSTSTQAITANTVTYLTGSAITTANIKAGTVVTWTISVTKTNAGTAAPAWTVKFGTNASTADTTLLSFTGAAQTAAVDTGIITIQCTFRTVGSETSARLVGHYSLIHQLDSTGLSTGNGGAFATSAGFNSTTANAFLGVTVNSGASAVWTVNQVNVKIENIV